VRFNSQKISIFKKGRKMVKKFNFKKNDIFIKELNILFQK